MRHLDPQQIAPLPIPTKTKRAAHPGFWVAGVLLVTGGLGWVGTHYFSVPQTDAVSQSERGQRVDDYKKLLPVPLRPVPDTEIDSALRSMQLDSKKQAELKGLLVSTDKVAVLQVTGLVSPLPGVKAMAARPSGLKLVELSLWDSHAPDGDVVVVTSAGYVREVVLTKQPQVITVPVSGPTISIMGLKDGGGGITLAVRGATQEVLMPILSEGQTIALPVAF